MSEPLSESEGAAEGAPVPAANGQAEAGAAANHVSHGPPAEASNDLSSERADELSNGHVNGSVRDGNQDLVPDHAEEQLAEIVDDAVPARGYLMQPIVGLGGSAGSIAALQSFFRATPPESGLAFVVVVHLARDFESTLAAVLQRVTAMPVVQVTDGVRIEPNSVYVIPPGQSLTSIEGTLRLGTLEHEHGRRFTVDGFFRTLADSNGPNAMAVVLSGMDGDGAVGIKRIKERGGLTVAQDADEADYPDMPRTAIATGMVDWVLKVEDMPARLVSYQQLGARLRLPPESIVPAPPPEGLTDEAALRDVFSLLHTRTGRNFAYYKRATMLRRVARRMQVCGIAHLPGYLRYLRTHPGEAGMLLQDLLISVTNFFRDAHAFDVLARHIPNLFKNKSAGEAVRVWVPACATGEEAYSIAILLQEYARNLDAPPAVQVFATDLDEQAIQTARNAFYPSAIAADVSPERLRRFFTKERHGWRVRRELREAVLFAPHDLLVDSPFSRLDLVSCRNLMIYLNREAQHRALDIFHFSLHPGGLLFLGASESVDDGNEWFAAVDRKHHLYNSRTVPRANLAPVSHRPPPAILVGRRVSTSARLLPATLVPPTADVSQPQAVLGLEAAGGRPTSWNDLHYRLLEKLSPPSVLVNPQHDIVHLSESAGRFLQFGGGEPSRNLFRSVLPALRVELRAALYRAAQSNQGVEIAPISVQIAGTARMVRVRVQPVPEIAPEFTVIIFDELDADAQPELAQMAAVPVEPLTLQLESELEGLKLQLRDIVEQAEASTEELEASNEELQAMNEELRSATEELETGREELTAVNEELTAVNDELKNKVDQLAHANSDLRNLMAATAIATVFLDRELRITRYTPSAVGLFNLIPSDAGRPLSDLAGRLDHPELARDAARALNELALTEREVAAEGRWYLARALPYRTTDDRIAGVVLTFIDITERKQAEEALRFSREQLRLILENARDYAIVATDLERRVTTWNPGAERLLGYSEGEIIGQLADVVFTPEDRASGAPAREAEQALTAGRASDERWHQRRDGSRFWGSGVMMAMHDAVGKVVGMVKIFRDQTETRLSIQALEQSRAEVEAASRAKDRFLAVLSHELRTPLTPVLMAVDAMSGRDDLPEAVHEILDMARRNVMAQTHMIDDLLDVTRISHGRLDIVPAPMDLHEAVQAAIDVCQPMMIEKKQRLTVELVAPRHHIVGDFNRLRQAMWNLLQNACKFTPERGTITVASTNDNGNFTLAVTDEGIGIAPDVLPTIFEAFAQGGSGIAREFGGLGLGLAIVQATVEAHGGTVQARSDGPHTGAQFRIQLPLRGKESS